MKLYATVASERASKGQGGKWLTIELKDETGTVFERLSVKEAIDDGYDLWIARGDYEPSYLVRHYPLKGNKQKGKYQAAPTRDCDTRDCGRCIACLRNQ